jgi:hypothetical protein
LLMEMRSSGVRSISGAGQIVTLDQATIPDDGVG